MAYTFNIKTVVRERGSLGPYVLEMILASEVIDFSMIRPRFKLYRAGEFDPFPYPNVLILHALVTEGTDLQNGSLRYTLIEDSSWQNYDVIPGLITIKNATITTKGYVLASQHTLSKLLFDLALSFNPNDIDLQEVIEAYQDTSEALPSNQQSQYV